MSVAVVIPLFNTARYVQEAVESVLAQSRPADEIIVVDDCSTDEGPSIVSRFPVTLVRPEKNLGLPGARNFGAARASSDFIALLDADDVWRPHHLATVVPLLERYPEVAVAFGRVQLFGDLHWDQEQRIPPNEPVDAYWEQYRENMVIPSASIVRRSVWEEIGGFNPLTRNAAEDLEFFLAIAARHRFAMSDKLTVGYRKHGAQMTTATRPITRQSEYQVRVRLLAEARASRSKEFVARMEKAMLATWQMRLGEAWASRSDFWMKFYLDLHSVVPGSAAAYARWRLKARLLPLARLVDRTRQAGRGLRVTGPVGGEGSAAKSHASAD